MRGNGPNLEFGAAEFRPTFNRRVERLYDPVVRYPGLPHGKRIPAARVSGSAVSLAWGRGKDLPLDVKLAELWAITRDPQILGHTMGPYLAEEPATEGGRAVLDLLRAAGADEAAGELNAQWQRWRQAQREQGGFTL